MRNMMCICRDKIKESGLIQEWRNKIKPFWQTFSLIYFDSSHLIGSSLDQDIYKSLSNRIRLQFNQQQQLQQLPSLWQGLIQSTSPLEVASGQSIRPQEVFLLSMGFNFCH